MNRLRQSTSACGLLLWLTTRLAAAEPASGLAPSLQQQETSPASRAEQARQHGHLGLAAFAEQRFDEALAHFTEAERWMHSPVFLLYMARSEQALGDLERARELYERVAEADLPKDAPSAWLDARISAREALAELPSTPTDPADPAPEAVTLTPDDAQRAPTPTPQPKPNAADRPMASPYPYRTGAYAAFGVGLVGLVGGSVAGGLAIAQAADIKSRCEGQSCLASDEPKRERALRLAHVATAGFVVAAVGAAAGITLWLLPGPTPEGLTVTLSPGHAELSGRF